jgi:hypothetical protein
LRVARRRRAERFYACGALQRPRAARSTRTLGGNYDGVTQSATLPRVKVTSYFEAVRKRPDRALIRDEWIGRAISAPIREVVQKDGRIRCWVQVPEMENRYLRVILLSDRETVHNAFFDRGFVP